MNTTPSNLSAIQLHDTWAVEDSDGGIWHPDSETASVIEASADPAAEAVMICDSEPMRGTWAQ